MRIVDLDFMLEAIGVDSLDDDHTIPKGWYAVIDDDGFAAFFPRENDALRYRLSLINRRLNP